jgi:hypothetical protein
MAFQQENLLFNIGVPDEDVVIETSTQKQMLLIIPVEGVHSSLMAHQLMLRLQIFQRP